MGLMNWLVQRSMRKEAGRVAKVMFSLVAENRERYPNVSEAEIAKSVLYPHIENIPEKTKKRLEACCETVNGICYVEVLDCGRLKRWMNFRQLQFTYYMDKELLDCGFPRQSKQQKERILGAMGLDIPDWDVISHD